MPGVLMVNLGKNKTADAIPDYTYGVKKFKDVADMMVRERGWGGGRERRRGEREGGEERRGGMCMADR